MTDIQRLVSVGVDEDRAKLICETLDEPRKGEFIRAQENEYRAMCAAFVKDLLG